MNLKAIRRPLLTLAALSSMTLFLVACASTAPVCGSPQSRNLNTAIDGVQTSLINGSVSFSSGHRTKGCLAPGKLRTTTTDSST
jgi:hypothetical protein